MACGVLGIVLKENEKKLREYTSIGLNILNHRGESSHGYTYLNSYGNFLTTRKSEKLVRDSEILEQPMSGYFLIGHTRYTTSSTSDLKNAQPIQDISDFGVQYAISHNGNINNDEKLKTELGIKEEGISDTKVLGKLLCKSLGKKDVIDSIKENADKIIGSYSIALLVADSHPRIVAVRDRFGYMPLCVGENDDGFFVASETIAFEKNYLNGKYRELKPGEIVVLDRHGISPPLMLESTRRQACMFQYLYMCRPDTFFEGVNVHKVRKELGKRIALNYKPKVDIIVPIPDSGWSVAMGIQQATGIPLDMGLVKDRYMSKRSFMQDNQEVREDVLRKKLTPMKEVVAGKRVLLADDTIVRGSTIKRNISEVRKSGAVEVHVAVSGPPIKDQCHYGVDIYGEQLIARTFMNLSHREICEAIAKEIGADSMYYTTIEDLVASIGFQKDDICLSCLTGKHIQSIVVQTEAERRK